MSSDITLTRDGDRAQLTLNRPNKRNALNLAMWAAIPGLLASLDEDANVRCLVVRGAGGVFAAGADIAEFETAYATREAAHSNQTTMVAAMRALEAFPKPVVALIEGPCIGAGLGVALCCDVRVASANARFGVTPARLGVAYGLEDSRRLVDAAGASAAKDLLFTGRIIDAGEALRLRLVDRVLPEDGFAEGSEAYLEQVCAGAPFTARATKALLAMIREGIRAETDQSRAVFADAFEGPDFREGVRAFAEKRTPKFT